jgi:hypothetical protein
MMLAAAGLLCYTVAAGLSCKQLPCYRNHAPASPAARALHCGAVGEGQWLHAVWHAGAAAQ